MYWMARYVERAEHVARLLLVNSNLLIDVGDLAPALQARQWQSILTILRICRNLPRGTGICRSGLRQYLTFDQENPNSILISCISRRGKRAGNPRKYLGGDVGKSERALLVAAERRCHGSI